MTHEELTRSITEYAASLARHRDEELAEAAAHPSIGVSVELRGRAAAYRLALDSLHIWTKGAFGTPLDDQPNVWQTYED